MSVHEIKSEPLEEEAEGIHENLDDDRIQRAEDTSNIFFDYEEEDKTPPIKEEIKEEIKTEPLVEDNIEDDENHVIDVENDQEKSDLQAMVDKLLLEKQTLLKDMDKLVELQVENQILKSNKTNLERQLEDKVKELEHKVNDLQVKNQNLREQLLQLNSNPIVLLKTIKKSDVAQSLEFPEEELFGFPSKDMNISDPEVSSNFSDLGANQGAFEELIIPESNNDNPEENMKKVKKRHHSTKSDSNIINDKRTLRKLIRYDEEQLDDISSDSGSDKNYCPTNDIAKDETENDEFSDMEDLQEKTKQTTKKLDSKVTLKDKKYKVNKKHALSSQRKTVNGKQINYKCKICGKEFGTRFGLASLNRHIITVHEKQIDYNCKICGKEFGLKGNLNIHIKTVHEKQKDYKCESCGETFGLKQSLKRHIITVHEKKRKYKCDYCSKKYSRKEKKERHERKIHNIV